MENKLTWRDGVATLLLAAVVAVYGFYLAWGGVTFISDGSGGTAFGILDPTGMAALGLVFGAIAAYVGGWVVIHEGAVVRYLTGGVGLVTLVLGLLALTGENIFGAGTVWEGVLGAFMAGTVVLWVIATGRHLGLAGSGSTRAPAGTTPA